MKHNPLLASSFDGKDWSSYSKIPFSLKSMNHGTLNLVYNEEFKTKNGNTKRILMYAPGYLEEIKEKLLYYDGTFKCCSDPFEQLYARVENQTIPILYAILSSKSNEAYTEVFKVVRAMVGDR